jgi:sensor histidine kinase regulating citrate/malate metabolism
MVHNVQVKLENQNLQILNSYYKELESNQTEIRKLRHDMNNQLATIGNLITSGNTAEAKDYFDTLSYVVAGSNRAFCKNGIVNAVLNVKYNLATEYNIDCFFNIDIDSVLSINAIDLCSLFANTLDNALEASMQIEEPLLRKIEVKARCDKGYFSYQITNNKSNQITVINNCYITSKADVKSHGFGIKTLKDIVQKYNGTLDITYTETEFTVLVIISDQGK